MDMTPNLKLPYILAAQAQKHVTHNEGVRALDALVQLAVLDRDLASPPASPVDGARYIVAAGATGTWSGQALRIAAWQDGAWAFFPPLEGWIAWIADEDIAVAWSGAAWLPLSGSASVNPTPLVGVNATADATNRLAVASPASLFNHEGAGHQLKVNKAAAANTASVLFQDAFSGRAEMGLAGDDDLHVKVSADGAVWREAIVVNRSTGAVTLPNTAGVSGAAGPAFAGRLNFVSTTSIALDRDDGSEIFVAGANRTIPAAGVALANTGLAASTLYYVYAYLNAGVLALEASTTIYAADATYGHPVKSSDATRSLVGMVRTTTGSLFASSATQRFVLSYHRRRPLAVSRALAAGASITAGPFTEIDSATRVEFLSWPNQPTLMTTSGQADQSGAANFNYLAVGIGTTFGTIASNIARFFGRVVSAGYAVNLSAAESFTPSAGYNWATLTGGVSSGTGFYASTYTAINLVISG